MSAWHQALFQAIPALGLNGLPYNHKEWHPLTVLQCGPVPLEAFLLGPALLSPTLTSSGLQATAVPRDQD